MILKFSFPKYVIAAGSNKMTIDQHEIENWFLYWKNVIAVQFTKM